jgi:hypothetical protein
MAMLTGVVNIAVFAVFQFCRGRRSGADAELKAVCGMWQRDISRYGRQRWQETARDVCRLGCKTLPHIVPIANRCYHRWNYHCRHSLPLLPAASSGSISNINFNFVKVER